MKKRYPGLLALLVIFMLIASSVLLAEVAKPTPTEANSNDILCWTAVDTPGSVAGKHDILSPSECNRIAIAPDGATIWVVDTPAKAIRKSSDGGVSWSDTANSSLHTAMTSAGVPEANQVIWDLDTAPDDSNFVAVVTGSATSASPTEVWISDDGGVNWDDAEFPALTVNTDGVISCIDISTDYVARRDIVVGLRNGTATAASEMLFVRDIASPDTWEDNSPPYGCDVIAFKFSPTYIADNSIVAVVSGPAGTATWLINGIRNWDSDTTTWPPLLKIEVKDPSWSDDSSPDATTIITADLELPSNYSAQPYAPRRAYVNLDAGNVTSEKDGIFRVDDDVVYTMMDNSTATDRRISSIAYYGTYLSGKMLAGEVLGYPCEATVPTWFTDSPTACPILCWYPAQKPPTGAANQGTCGSGSKDGYGNAQVVWSPTYADQGVAYCVTSSAALGPYSTPDGTGTEEWPDGYLNNVYLDESALAITRNNSETWNQLSLIDTKIDKLTDVAVSPDSSTVYLATVNQDVGCGGFDSVWRSSSNPAIVSPLLPAVSIGAIWERIRCHITAKICTDTQSDYAILRLAPNETDGQFLFWAAQGTDEAAWSPDFGDYWGDINPSLEVQDMAAESSDKLYILDDTGVVQMMPRMGTAWSRAYPRVDTALGSGFSIAALADGHVLVGAGASSSYPAAYSGDSAGSFDIIDQSPGQSNFQVAFDTDFTTNGLIYAAADNTTDPRSIYRNTVPGPYSPWIDLEPLGVGYHGLAISSRGTLYAANPLFVERTLYPETGVPGELEEWDVLMYDLSGFPIRLTLSPNSLRLSGGLTPDDNTMLWAIDDSPYLPLTASDGRLWIYEDSFARAGPTVSGDITTECNSAVNIPWGQVSGGQFYEIQLADDAAFTTGVWMHLWYEPLNLANPELVVPAGGLAGGSVDTPAWVGTLSADVAGILGVSPNMDAIGLGTTISVPALYPECGHVYYQRVRAVGSTGEDVIRSPWSATRTVTISPP